MFIELSQPHVVGLSYTSLICIVLLAYSYNVHMGLTELDFPKWCNSRPNNTPCLRKKTVSTCYFV